MGIQKAFELAKEWCDRNPKWKRICDIKDSDALMLGFDELPKRDRREWESKYPGCAEDAWREFSSYRPARHRFGFIGEDGNFYDCVTHIPRMTNHMMVFEVGGKEGIYYVGGKSARSSAAKC